MKRAHGLVVSLALVVALAACAPTPLPATTADPKPTSAAKPTAKATPTQIPTPTPTPTVEPLSLPDCETLLPLAIARDLFSHNTEFLGEIAATDFIGRMSVPSLPAVQSTATPARACFWGVPQSDGLFQLLVGGLTAVERGTLQGELTAAGYTSTTMGTLTAFELAGENEVGSTGTTHLFTGDVWIVCDGTSTGLSGAVAGQALDALRTANPSLGL